MLLVKTKVKSSDTSGIGLFADQFIPKGTHIWKFQPPFDFMVSKEEYVQLPELMRKHILHYGYLNMKTGKYIIFTDNAGFFNHSDTPNVTGILSPYDDEGINIAAENICPEEELLVNYKDYDADFKRKLGLDT